MTNVRIFVSSPGELKAELNELARVVERINKLHQKEYGINFVLETVNKDITPSFGRPQEIISEKFGQYDIFIGILWKRFGTPTSSESGTEEEFKFAIKKYEKNQNVRLLFFFKQTPYMPQSSLEMEQFSKVLHFKEEVSSHSIINTYETLEEFRDLINEALIRYAQEENKLKTKRASSRKPHQIFISYNHKDEVWKDKLYKYLKILENEGTSILWYDKKISAGEEWEIKIKQAINETAIAIFMISVDFLNSDFIMNEEVPAFLRLREEKGIIIYPILCRPTPWKIIQWLKELQMRPDGARPLSSGNEFEQENHLTAIVEEIDSMLKKLS